MEYSIDGGTTWHDAMSMHVAGPNYFMDDPITGFGSNPLAGRYAFASYITEMDRTILDLSPLAGESVLMRFRIGTDSYIWYWGWFIDNVRAYTCTDGDILDFVPAMIANPKN